MATKKNETETAVKENRETAKDKRVRVKLPRLSDTKASQVEFFSVNFKNYLIKRGEYVEVPAELAEVIANGEKAEEAAFEYSEKKKGTEQ